VIFQKIYLLNATAKTGGNQLKIFDIKSGTAFGNKNSLSDAIIIRMSLPATDGVLMSETVIFGKDTKGNYKILSLADDGTVGNAQYEKVFIKGVKDLKGDNATKLKEYGDKFEFINKSGKVVDGEVTVNGKAFRQDNSGNLIDSNGRKVTEEDIKKIGGATCEGDSCETVKQADTESVNSNIEQAELSYIKKYAEDLNELSSNKNYFSSYKEGMKVAKEKNKDVVVIAVSETCKPCKNLIKNVFKNSKFRDFDDKIFIFQDSDNINSDVTKQAGSPTSTPQSYVLRKNNNYTAKVASNGLKLVEEYKEDINKKII